MMYKAGLITLLVLVLGLNTYIVLTNPVVVDTPQVDDKCLKLI